MTRTPFFSFLALVLVLIVGWNAAPLRMNLAFDSKIWVEGTSTMHDWSCRVGQLDGNIEVAPDAAEKVGNVAITVPARSLECKNGTMNKKAHEALEAKAHPEITYQLTHASLDGASANGFVLKTTGRLTIAGTTRNIDMTVNGQVLDDGRVRFTGSTPLKMSDFGIDPPTAMLGAMKTGNEVTVHFDVIATR